jgi:hypothetical protein
LDKASKEGPTTTVVRRVGNPHLFASVPGRDSKIAGLACTQTFDIEEGEIIKVFVDVRASYGQRPKRANVYLRMRASAAHRVLEFGITDHASAEFTKGVAEGTFDILTLPDVLAEGVAILAHFKPLCAPSAVRKAITANTVIREQTEAVKKVEVKSVEVAGKAVEITVSARPKRRIGGAS